MSIQFDEATHTYTVDGQPFASVTQLIKEFGMYGDAARWFDEYSSDRGSKVHEAVRLHLDGTLDVNSLDPVILPYYQAWMKFEKESDFYPAYIEHTMINEGIKVAGRADLIGPFGGKAAIIDIKTSATPHPATGVQLAGYEYLYGGGFLKRLALHLGADGNYRLVPYTDRNDRNVFLAAATIHNWRQANKIGG